MGGTAAHVVTVDTCMKSNWHTGSSGRQYPSLRTATGPQQATNMETHASLCSTCKKGRQVSLARPMRVRFGTRNKKRCSHLCSSTRGDQHVSIVGHAGVCAERLPCCLYSAAAAAASYVVVPGVLIWIWRWRDVTGGGWCRPCHFCTCMQQHNTQAEVVSSTQASAADSKQQGGACQRPQIHHSMRTCALHVKEVDRYPSPDLCACALGEQ